MDVALKNIISKKHYKPKVISTLVVLFLLSLLISCTGNSSCCKICRKGKACGDACVSKKYTCHQPKGCACNY